MIKNYITIAWRNITRHKLFSLLNVLGLALSISAGLIILLLYQDGYSYDKFHNDADLIYRVNTLGNRKNGDVEPYATTPPSIAKSIGSNFSWIDKVTSLQVFEGEIMTSNENIHIDGKITDNNFLDIFNFKLTSGDAGTALQAPNSIVLTSALSQKLFAGADPIDKVINIEHHGSYKVTGVIQPNPGKTHFEFEALLSQGQQDQKNIAWDDLASIYTYVKVKPNTNMETAVAAFDQQFSPAFKNLPIVSRENNYHFELQALPEITPGYSIANGMGKGLPFHLLRILAIMGIVVMASAIFNYTNLTLAKALRRAKEIGVRKVMGARRRQIIFQIISEGVVLSLVALAIALGFLAYFKVELNQLQTFQFFDFDVSITLTSLLYFILFAFITGVIAGFLPAIALSKLNVLSALRKIENLGIVKQLGLTKTLLVVQLVFSMLFIMTVTTLHQQIKYAVNMDYGFNADEIYNVQLQGESAAVVKTKFNSLPGVETVSAMDVPMGTYDDTQSTYKLNEADELKKVKSYAIDEALIPNLELDLVAGKNFTANEVLSKHELIVNELFVRKNELGTNTEAIGKTVFLNDTMATTIAGVVKDYKFLPADEAIKPLILRYSPPDWNMLNVKIASGQSAQTIAALKQAWKEIAPNRAFQGELYNTTIQNNYAIYKDINKVIQFFAMLGIVICLMGLLGMTIHSVERRQKEISLRKVLGASEREIVFTLSKNFARLLIIGFAISIPIGMWLCSIILHNFANRINAGINLIYPGVILLTLLAIVTIGSQTIKAATANPVKNLRTE